MGIFPSSIRNTWIWQNPFCCFEGQNSDLLDIFFTDAQSVPSHSLSEAKQLTSPIAKGSAPSNVCRVGGWFSSNDTLVEKPVFWLHWFFQKSSVEPFIERSHSSAGFRSSARLVGTDSHLTHLTRCRNSDQQRCWSFPMARLWSCLLLKHQLHCKSHLPAKFQRTKKVSRFLISDLKWSIWSIFLVWVGDRMDCKNCNNCTTRGVN